MCSSDLKPYKTGRITKEELHDSVVINNDCWEWKYSMQRGNYGTFRRHGKQWTAHRISYFMFHSNAPMGVLTDRSIAVRHKCDNPPCINPNHLELGTHRDNVMDKVNRDRHNRGRRVWKAKLYDEDIKTIFRLHRQGHPIRRIAEYYDISYSSIYLILQRKAWKHVNLTGPCAHNEE